MKGVRAQLGLNLVEVSLITFFTGAVLLASVGLLGTSEEVAADSRADLLGESSLRRGINALANVMRDATLDSLDGFNTSGLAFIPRFQRVVDATNGQPVLGTEVRLEWQPAHGGTPGIQYPGAVVLIDGSEVTVLANRIPSGGFSVEQSGRSLLINLTTWQQREGGVVHQETGQTSVSLRN